jgi:hypothetical protein
MNLRIDEQGLRFRVTPEDLRRLLDDGAISHTLGDGNGKFFCGIELSPDANVFFRFGTDGLRLYAPRSVLEELDEMGLSRQGLSFRQGDTEISLQVDIKAQAGRLA